MSLIRAVLYTALLVSLSACTTNRSPREAPPPDRGFVFQERCDFRSKKNPCASKQVGASCGVGSKCLATGELGKIAKDQSMKTKFFSCSCDSSAPAPFAKSSCKIVGRCSDFGDVYSIEYDSESCPLDYECPVPSRRDPVWDSISCKKSSEGPIVSFKRPCVRGKISKANKRQNRFLQGLKGPQRRSDQVPILW